MRDVTITQSDSKTPTPESKVRVKLVQNLKVAEVKSWRVGVTPFIVVGGQAYFAYAIDRTYKQICNFAGGLKDTDADVIAGSLREFAEESQGVFGSLTVDQIATSIALYDDEEFCIFVRVNVDADRVRRNFHYLERRVGNEEVCDIIWLTTSELQEQIALGERSVMYDKVRLLLSRFIAPEVPLLMPPVAAPQKKLHVSVASETKTQGCLHWTGASVRISSYRRSHTSDHRWSRHHA